MYTWPKPNDTESSVDYRPWPILDTEKMNPVDCVVCLTLKSMCLDQTCNMLIYDDCRLDLQPCRNFGIPVTDTLCVNSPDGSYESYAYIALLRGDEEPFEVSTERIECATLQEQVSRCSEYHYQYGYVAPKRAPMQSLRVIDRLDKKVIMSSDDCTYLALSYIWGANLSSYEVCEAACSARTDYAGRSHGQSRARLLILLGR